MADTSTKPKPRPVQRATEVPPRTVVRSTRTEAEMAALIAEAERIMGVQPIRVTRMLPGY